MSPLVVRVAALEVVKEAYSYVQGAEEHKPGSSRSLGSHSTPNACLLCALRSLASGNISSALGDVPHTADIRPGGAQCQVRHRCISTPHRGSGPAPCLSLTLSPSHVHCRASILEDLLSCQQGLAALWHGQQAHQPSATALSALSSPHPVWQHSSHRHYAGRITEDPKEKQRRVKEAQRAAKGAAPQVDATATAPVETATPTRVEKSM